MKSLFGTINMRILNETNETIPCALALGNFDGLHSAHIKIIKSCAEFAHQNKIPGGVLLFENHTQSVVAKEEIKLLTTLEEKLKILEEIGVDFVYIVRFDEEFMRKTPEEFFSYLKDNLKAKALFAGFDYRFGYKAKGNVSSLKKMGDENNITVSIFDAINVCEDTVSSTMIRNLIQNGKVDSAALYLGRAYSILGKVVHGKKNGTKMGLPTANVEIGENKLIPPDGVYFGFTIVEGKKYKSLINIGKNPTFGENKRTVESHIIDFCGDLYESIVELELCEKIRDEIKFSSPDELIKQIKADLKYINRKGEKS